LQVEQEARLKADEEARKVAKQEARLKVEEEACLLAEQETIRQQAEQEARLFGEQEAAENQVEEENGSRDFDEDYIELDDSAQLDAEAELEATRLAAEIESQLQTDDDDENDQTVENSSFELDVTLEEWEEASAEEENRLEGIETSREERRLKEEMDTIARVAEEQISAQMKEQMSKMSGAIKDKDAEIDALQQKIIKMEVVEQAKLKKMESEAESKLSELSNAQIQYNSKADEEISAMSNALNKKDQAIIVLQQKIDEMEMCSESKYAKEKLEGEEKVSELLITLTKKDDEIEALRNQFERCQEGMEEIHSSSVQEAEAKSVELSSMLEGKDVEIQDLRQHFEEYRQELEKEHNAQLMQVQAKADQMMLELNQRDAGVGELHEQYAKQRKDLEKSYNAELQTREKNLKKITSELDNKNAEMKKLNVTLADAQKVIKEKAKEHEEVEDEADELHNENEELHQKVEDLEKAKEKLKEKVKSLESNSSNSMGLQIELQLLKDEKDREVQKVEDLKESKNSSQAALSAERDAAKAEVLDLQQRLAAVQADLEVAQADYYRAMTSSSNLQEAMAAFSDEREAEIALLEDSRNTSEEALLAAHELALQAMKQENNRVVQEMHMASDKAVTNMMNDLKESEAKQEVARRESVSLRRSLDEAIQRLQTNEEDVIDRALMKNILLDWHSKSGKAKRDVMAVMSSVLHFSDSEKEKCFLNDTGNGIGKVVGSLAPPIASPAISLDDLEGNNIKEKWVNFLLSESDNQPPKSAPKMKTKSRSSRTTKATAI